ncbi:MAG: PTS lactose/cellobiose transporter subunit IIA [Erysipelotrichaceae bacterium]
MEGLELVCFTIIANVGGAKSMYLEAINVAKQGNYEEAKAMIEEGAAMFIEGHKAHMELVQKEASGEAVSPSLLLLHAEDQLMSAETIKIMALEFIELYEKVNA